MASGKPKKIARAPRPIIDGPGIAILLPTRGRVTIETMQSLNAVDGHRVVVLPATRMDVVDARNKLVNDVRNVKDKGPFQPTRGWYALWVDDDAFWRPGMLSRMLECIQEPDIDILAGWFCGRAEFSSPKCFFEDGSWPIKGQDFQEFGELLEVARVGFHFVLHKVDILEKLPADPFTLRSEGGEDINFCDRAREAGLRIWVDTAAMIAHIGDDGNAYYPGCAAMRVVNGQLVQQTEQRTYGEQLDKARELAQHQ